MSVTFHDRMPDLIRTLSSLRSAIERPYEGSRPHVRCAFYVRGEDLALCKSDETEFFFPVSEYHLGLVSYVEDIEINDFNGQSTMHYLQQVPSVRCDVFTTKNTTTYKYKNTREDVVTSGLMKKGELNPTRVFTFLASHIPSYVPGKVYAVPCFTESSRPWILTYHYGRIRNFPYSGVIDPLNLLACDKEMLNTLCVIRDVAESMMVAKGYLGICVPVQSTGFVSHLCTLEPCHPNMPYATALLWGVYLYGQLIFNKSALYDAVLWAHGAGVHGRLYAPLPYVPFDDNLKHFVAINEGIPFEIQQLLTIDDLKLLESTGSYINFDGVNCPVVSDSVETRTLKFKEVSIVGCNPNDVMFGIYVGKCYSPGKTALVLTNRYKRGSRPTLCCSIIVDATDDLWWNLIAGVFRAQNGKFNYVIGISHSIYALNDSCSTTELISRITVKVDDSSDDLLFVRQGSNHCLFNVRGFHQATDFAVYVAYLSNIIDPVPSRYDVLAKNWHGGFLPVPKFGKFTLRRYGDQMNTLINSHSISVLPCQIPYVPDLNAMAKIFVTTSGIGDVEVYSIKFSALVKNFIKHPCGTDTILSICDPTSAASKFNEFFANALVVLKGEIDREVVDVDKIYFYLLHNYLSRVFNLADYDFDVNHNYSGSPPQLLSTPLKSLGCLLAQRSFYDVVSGTMVREYCVPDKFYAGSCGDSRRAKFEKGMNFDHRDK